MDDELCFSKFCPHVRTIVPEDKHHISFLQQITDEGLRVRETHEAEIKMTAENPRVRQLNDLNDIAQKLGVFTHREAVDEKERKQLRVNSLELRGLRAQLQTAFAAKQLSEQRELHERQKIEERLNKNEERDRFAEELQRIQEERRARIRGEIRKKEQYRKGLQEQMLEKEKVQQQRCVEALREREVRLKQEQEYRKFCEGQQKEALQLKLRRKQEVEDYLQIHANAKEKLREKERRYIELDTAYVRQREEHQAEAARALMERRARQEALSDRIGQQVFNMENEKRASENMLLDLLVEERINKEEMRHKETLEKLNRDREQSRIEGQNYRQHLLRYKQMIEKKEDEMYVEDLKRKSAEIAEKEAQENEKRLEIKQKYGREMRFLIDQKRRQIAEQEAESRKEDEMIQNMIRAKQKIIEEERERILRKQPAELIPFIRPGTLHDYERQFLGRPSSIACLTQY